MNRHKANGATIRPATLADAAAVAEIYAHHVLHGTASFDTEPPPAGAMRVKIAHILRNDWPFLIAEQGGEAVGYAYATQFRDRPAYRRTCESSIYIRHDRTGLGIGRRLMTALIEASRGSGFAQMIAVIGGPEPASLALHMGAGFREAGRMHSVGCKFGRLLDTVYMQRALVDGSAPECEEARTDS